MSEVNEVKQINSEILDTNKDKESYAGYHELFRDEVIMLINEWTFGDVLGVIAEYAERESQDGYE